MKKYICKKKCFYKTRIWQKGATLNAQDDEAVPPHFVEAGGFKPSKVVETKPPQTLSEITYSDPKVAEEQKSIDAVNSVDEKPLIPKKKRGRPKRTG